MLSVHVQYTVGEMRQQNPKAEAIGNKTLPNNVLVLIGTAVISKYLSL